MGAIYGRPINETSAWTPESLARDSSFDLHLDDAQRDELLAASSRTEDRPLWDVDAASFPLPRCAPVLEKIRTGLIHGHGFALLHGFPVEGRDRSDIERMYWGFCAHLGTGVTQNGDASLIHYVTEGRLRPSQGTRAVGNPGKVSLHVDLADCVSLLCVRQAADSPPSRLSSSTTLHNKLLERAPGSLERLYRGFVWDRQNEHGDGELPTTGYRVPMFSERDGAVSCRYNRNWITKAVQREGEGFSEADERLLDLVDEITHEHCHEFAFEAGDVQFANNYTVLHGRAPHTPATSEAQTRLLMRTWFNMDDIRPFADEAIVRHGIVRHGRLGWTARQLARGLDNAVHARRASDGAPA